MSATIGHVTLSGFANYIFGIWMLLQILLFVILISCNNCIPVYLYFKEEETHQNADCCRATNEYNFKCIVLLWSVWNQHISLEINLFWTNRKAKPNQVEIIWFVSKRTTLHWSRIDIQYKHKVDNDIFALNTIAYYKSCGIWRNDLRQEIFLDNELFKTW